jgi:hypothetical protein
VWKRLLYFFRWLKPTAIEREVHADLLLKKIVNKLFIQPTPGLVVCFFTPGFTRGYYCLTPTGVFRISIILIISSLSTIIHHMLIIAIMRICVPLTLWLKPKAHLEKIIPRS